MTEVKSLTQIASENGIPENILNEIRISAFWIATCGFFLGAASICIGLALKQIFP